MSADLLALLERVKAATGADRFIDDDLTLFFRRRDPDDPFFDRFLGYTCNIDTAFALVDHLLRGWTWSVDCHDRIQQNPNGWFWATVRPGDALSTSFYRDTAPTAPLAILSALLSALIDAAPSLTVPVPSPAPEQGGRR